MSILDRNRRDDKDEYGAEADIIVVAAILGYAATRIHQGQPFSFDIEHPTQRQQQEWAGLDPNLVPLSTESEQRRELLAAKSALSAAEARELRTLRAARAYTDFLRDWQGFLDALSAVSAALHTAGFTEEQLKQVKDAQSPQWFPGAVITGRAGGALSAQRHRQPGDLAAARAAVEALSPSAYLGRGAYTGIIDDPVGRHSGVLKLPTRRLVAPEDGRWHPRGEAYWGLIDRVGPNRTDPLQSANLKPLAAGGMGPFESWDGQEGVVGYVHGMSQAMREAILRGPWCTPYEVAAGEETTKLASCFPCTLYMMAAGYPPSSTHLGRGESWHPLPADDPHPVGGGERARDPRRAREEDVLRHEIARSLNIRWHIEVHHYLTLGSEILRPAEPELKDLHRRARVRLAARLTEIPATQGGNLFLDALTVHDSEWKRIKRTLPAAELEVAAT